MKYAVVTNDVMEFPVYFGNSLKAIAEKTGMALSELRSQLAGKQAKGDMRIIRNLDNRAVYDTVAEMESAEGETYAELMELGVVIHRKGKYAVDWNR